MRIDMLLRSSLMAAFLALASHGVVAQTAPSAGAQVAKLTRQVQQDLREQRPDLAIPLLRRILAIDPNNLDASGNLGVLLYFQGNYAEAIRYLRAALQLKPDLWKIEALLGIAEKRTGDLNGARSDLERAFPHLDEKKIEIEAGLELIEADSAVGQLDRAASVAAALQDDAPEDPHILAVAYQIYYRLMDQTLLSMIVVAPDSAEMYMMMAHQMVRQGNNTAAMADYREALRLNPKLPGAHFELAELLRLSPDPRLQAEAGAEYRAALDVNQYDEGAWRGLGEVAADSGDLSTAERDYRKALSLQPSDSEAETDMAKVMTDMNHPHAAIVLLENAVKDDPTNIVAHYRLSMLYRQAGRTTAAQRELDAYLHYKALQDKLSKVFRQLRVEAVASTSARGPIAK